MKKNSGLLCRILNDDQEIVLVCKENRIKKITLLMFDHIHQSISDKYQTHIWLCADRQQKYNIKTYSTLIFYLQNDHP